MLDTPSFPSALRYWWLFPLIETAVLQPIYITSYVPMYCDGKKNIHSIQFNEKNSSNIQLFDKYVVGRATTHAVVGSHGHCCRGADHDFQSFTGHRGALPDHHLPLPPPREPQGSQPATLPLVVGGVTAAALGLRRGGRNGLLIMVLLRPG